MREGFGNGMKRSSRGNRIVGERPIEMESGNLDVLTDVFVAVPTRSTRSTGVQWSLHDSITLCKRDNVVADGIDDTDVFVAQNPWCLEKVICRFSLPCSDITPTNPCRDHPQSNVPGPRFRTRRFLHLERSLTPVIT
nr:hypothetical protein [Halanaeroarchaeum sp. HSR-CO]